jgi:NADPH-dependent ferric siderophore reductase
MTEQTDARGREGFRRGFAMRPPLRAWSLTVAGADNITPRMRRVRFTAPDLAEMNWRPGQDLVLALPQPNSAIARRHYTIRSIDGGELAIDFVLHGESPATAWARSARAGETIEAQGPRGRTSVRADAAHHYFVGDETCLPGIFAMVESLPAAARGAILIEIGDDADKQEIAAPTGISLRWISRGGARPGPSALLLGELKALTPDPAGAHAYIIGETSNVRAQRHYLVERGFAREQITAEGYWRPGRIGGHDHV